MATMLREGVLYTAKTHTTGGREGQSRSSDGRLDVKLTLPGTPVALPPDLAIDAEMDLRLMDGEYSLGARLNVSVPGVPREVAQALVDSAERTCPYSKAIKGNVPTTITLV